jgi:hypothetical protein
MTICLPELDRVLDVFPKLLLGAVVLGLLTITGPRSDDLLLVLEGLIPARSLELVIVDLLGAVALGRGLDIVRLGRRIVALCRLDAEDDLCCPTRRGACLGLLDGLDTLALAAGAELRDLLDVLGAALGALARDAALPEPALLALELRPPPLLRAAIASPEQNTRAKPIKTARTINEMLLVGLNMIRLLSQSSYIVTVSCLPLLRWQCL